MGPVVTRRRLCMVVHGPYPLKEGRVAREALAAMDAGWEVDVVAMRGPGEACSRNVDGVPIFRLPILGKRRGRHSSSDPGQVRRLHGWLPQPR